VSVIRYTLSESVLGGMSPLADKVSQLPNVNSISLSEECWSSVMPTPGSAGGVTPLANKGE
jgi:hypothetical protein